MNLKCVKVELEENTYKVAFVNPLKTKDGNTLTDIIVNLTADSTKNTFDYVPGKFYEITISEKNEKEK